MEAGVAIGRDRFFGLLREHGLLIERKRRKARTTDSRHGFRVYRNRLKEGEFTKPHEAWVSDLTYVGTDEGFLYLSLISDRVSRKIVGWEASASLSAEGSCRALRQALRPTAERGTAAASFGSRDSVLLSGLHRDPGEVGTRGEYDGGESLL